MSANFKFTVGLVAAVLIVAGCRYADVGGDGVTWTFPAYSVMAGCYGVLSATIPWRELEPYRR